MTGSRGKKKAAGETSGRFARIGEKQKLVSREIYQIFETAVDGIRIIDKEYNVLLCNTALSALAGKSTYEMMNGKCYETFPGELCHGPDCSLSRIIGGENRIQRDVMKKRNDGFMIPCIMTVSSFHNANGEVIGIVESFKDITQRKRIEEALKESEGKYHAIFDESRDGVVLINAETGRICDCNPEFERQTGRKLEQLLKMKIWDLRPPEKVEAAKRKFFEIKKRKAGGAADLEFQKPNGKTVPIEFKTKEMKILGERYLQSVTRDVTERRQAEEKLQKSESNYRKLVESSPDGIIVLSDKGYITDCNDGASKLLGYGKEELKIRNINELLTDVLPVQLSSYDRELTSPIKLEYELEFMHHNGELIPMWIKISPVYDSASNIFEFLMYLRDITERKKVDQLKDEFINLVSHEFRSPLTVIIGAVNTILSEEGRLSPEETRQLLRDAAAEADDLSHLLGNLLELSRAQANRLLLHPEPINVRDTVQQAIEIISRQSSAHRYILNFPDDIPQVHADQTRVERILHNLLENAVKYSPEGSEIKVTAKPQGEYVMIAVTDQGIGISPEEQARLFRSFERLEEFRPTGTTGTGLGLVVCERLVEAHGGRIWIESEPDQGSTFSFILPLSCRVAEPRTY